MKTLSQITLFLFSILVLSGCSKDKSIERHVQKNDGEWNIDNVTWTVVSMSGTSIVVDVNGTTSNAGTFTFENDGSGEYSYTIADTIVRTGSFAWTVDDEKVSITKVSQSINFSTFATTQKTVAYTGTESSKTKLTLEGSETDQIVDGANTSQLVITGTFTLTKK